MENIVGTPARGGDFFDREELVKVVWDRLEAGNNILLAAPRRFGKTSLMYNLIDQPRPGWKPIHVDAESIREPVNFVIALLDRLMADNRIRNFLMASWKGAGQWLRGLIDSAEFAGPWDVSLKIKLKEKLADHWQERGEELLRTLQTYANEEKLLIIIDELPVMFYLFRDNGVSDADARAFLYWFRKLRTDPMVGITNCRFLVGGSIGIEGYLSQLLATDSFNDFERISMSELGRDRAAEFVQSLLDSRAIELSPASRRKILDLLGAPIPYFAQVFVAEVAMAKAGGLQQIGPKQVEEIYHRQVLDASKKNYFQHYYDRLAHYPKLEEKAAKAILKELALAHPHAGPRQQLYAIYRSVAGESASEEVFGRLIANLENDFYIRYRPEEQGFSFASKILCDWWRRYYAF